MKIKWSTIKQLLKIAAAIITTLAGTYAVQSCAPHMF